MQTPGGDVEGLPDSVLGIVTARVDLLPPAEKELLRDAAVMGGVVWSDGLRRRLRARRDDGRRAAALARAQGVPPARAAVRRRRGHPARLRPHARPRRGLRRSCRGPIASTGTSASRGGSSRCPTTGARIVPSSSRTTTSRRSSWRGAPGSTSPSSSPRRRAALREAGMRAFAIGAFAAAVRALRAAAESLPGGLDARALRALGKALVFTEQRRAARSCRSRSTVCSIDGATAEAAVAAIDLSHSHWQHGDGAGSRGVDGAGARARRRDRPDARARLRARAGGPAQDARRSPGGGGRPRRRGDRARRGGRCARAARLRADHACDGESERRRLRRRPQGLRRGGRALARRARPERDRPRRTSIWARSCSTSATFAGAIAAARDGLALRAAQSGPWSAAAYSCSGNLCEALLPSRRMGARPRRSPRRGWRTPRRRGLTTTSPSYRVILAELGLVRDGQVERGGRLGAVDQVELARDRGDDQVVLPSLSRSQPGRSRDGRRRPRRPRCSTSCSGADARIPRA